MREYLSELVRMAPFSVDTLSEGNFWLFHSATVASSVNMDRGLLSGEMGILFLRKKSRNFSLMMMSLNLLLKGPTYDTKALANKASPMMTYSFSPKSMIA